jgi:hypothetical protein
MREDDDFWFGYHLTEYLISLRGEQKDKFHSNTNDKPRIVGWNRYIVLSKVY